MKLDAKVCSRCKIEKSLSEFSKNKRTPDGLKYSCKACISSDYFKNHKIEKEKRKTHYNHNKQEYLSRSYRWREENPNKRQISERKRALMKKYNLTWEAYEELFYAQEGECAICNLPLALFPYGELPSACVDHCHSTGQVRGLLCYNCNLILGHAKDNKDILIKAIEYLGQTN